MAQQDRLGLLHMCVTGHDGAEVLVGQPQKGRPQFVHGTEKRQRGILRVHPRVESDLVVARPCGMQPLTGVTYTLREHPFDGHVDVLVRGVEREGAPCDLIADDGESGHDGNRIRVRDDPACRKHPRMGHRTADISVPHAPIDRQRGAELERELVERSGEPTAPWRLRFGLGHVSDLPVLADLAPLARPDLRG
jgi:hypothetical protein